MYNNYKHKNTIHLFYFLIKKCTVKTEDVFLLNLFVHLFIFKDYLENIQQFYSFILYFYSYINLVFSSN